MPTKSFTSLLPNIDEIRKMSPEDASLYMVLYAAFVHLDEQITPAIEALSEQAKQAKLDTLGITKEQAKLIEAVSVLVKETIPNIQEAFPSDWKDVQATCEEAKTQLSNLLAQISASQQKGLSAWYIKLLKESPVQALILGLTSFGIFFWVLLSVWMIFNGWASKVLGVSFLDFLPKIVAS